MIAVRCLFPVESSRLVIRRLGSLALCGLLVGVALPAVARAQAWQAKHGLTPAQYQQAVGELKDKGLRPQLVSCYNLDSQERFAGIWTEAGNVAWEARHNLTPAEFQAKFNELLSQGYRLDSLSGYTVGGQERFVAIWSKSPGPEWAARNSLTSAQYQAAVEEFQKKGFRVQHVNGYTVGSQERYAAIWIKSDGVDWQARHGLTAAQFQQTFNDLTGKGFRIESISGYSVGGQERFAAVWTKSPGPEWQARSSLTSAQYQSAFSDFQSKGFRPLHVSGYSVNNQERFAAIWVKGPLGPPSAPPNVPQVIVQPDPPPVARPAAPTGSSRP